MEELFHHIHATKDNVLVEEEIERIRRRLHPREQPSLEQEYRSANFGQLDFNRKYYNTPKNYNEYYHSKSPSQSRSRLLDYQSTSKFSPHARTFNRESDGFPPKVAHLDDFYNLPSRNYYSQRKQIPGGWS
jgi:hypothetical protein